MKKGKEINSVPTTPTKKGRRLYFGYVTPQGEPVPTPGPRERMMNMPTIGMPSPQMPMQIMPNQVQSGMGNGKLPPVFGWEDFEDFDF